MVSETTKRNIGILLLMPFIGLIVALCILFPIVGIPLVMWILAMAGAMLLAEYSANK